MNVPSTRGPKTIPQALERSVQQFWDREAIVCGAHRVTYATLVDQVNSAARAFLASGVAKGDRVAILAPNSERWPVCSLALASIGAVLVPVNTRLKGPEIRHILRTSETSRIVVEEGFLGNSYVAMILDDESPIDDRERLSDLEEIIVFAEATRDGVTSFNEFLGRAAAVSDELLARAKAGVGPEDVSDIIFTSGTTGRPKGAVLRHFQTVALYTTWADIAGVQPGEGFLGVNPFFHCFGYKAGLLASVIKGATMLPVATFDAERTMQLIEAERASIVPGTPTLYISMLDHPERGRYDLSSLRVAVTGGSVVPTALLQRMRTELGFKTIINAYGLTEACGYVTSCRQGDPDEVISKTSGRPVEGVEVRIVGTDGDTLPPGDVGEVFVRGYNLMAGYYKDAENTAKAIDADGWLHTGDVGFQDAAGNLTITDRTKDMFVIGGYNAYPAEIEQVIMRHESVSDVAVIGVPDPRMGEVGRAYVVLRPDGHLSEDELIAFCRGRLANYKVPRSLRVVDALPRTGTGKVDKVTLRVLASQESQN